MGKSSKPSRGDDARPSKTTGCGGRLNFKKLESLARSGGASSSSSSGSRKHDKSPTSSSSSSAHLPWVERNFPNDADELFVHKKKVDEVRSWLQQARNSSRNRICLLSGPSGSGKTATLGVLAKELGLEIKEWINPLTLTDYSEDNNYFSGDDIRGRSQIDLFSDFLLRSSQYSTLPLRGGTNHDGRIVLVEDIPNIFYKEPPVFHSLLRNYQVHGTAPLIFLVPDNGTAGQFNPFKLFPKTVMQELQIHCISFNAVAPTLMKKFLNIICKRENISVLPSTLEGICIASGGDMRCAVNTLQFRILQASGAGKGGGGFKRPFPVDGKVRHDTVVKNDATVRHDESLFLFHALGKVLYNKRDRTQKSKVEYELKENLAQHRRVNPPESDPDEFLGKIEVSAETFIDFLHQNYPFFFSTMDTCALASGFLANAETLMSRWNYDDRYTNTAGSFKIKDTRDQCGVNVAVRGLMYANTCVRSSQYRPFKKPIWGDLRMKRQKNEERVRQALSSHAIVENVFTETLPLMSKIPWCSLSGEQQQIVSEVGLFKFKNMLSGIRDSRSALVWSQAELHGCTMDETSSGSSTAGVLEARATGRPVVVSVKTESCARTEDVLAPAEDFLIEDFED